MTTRITPNLWFDGNAEEAAEFYVSVFKDARITGKTHYPAGSPGTKGSVMTVSWELDGHKFVGINGGPQFKFNEAISFEVHCADQAEVDFYWERLTADGGKEGPCGWCTDRFGVSWQVVPAGMDELFADGDEERAARAFRAMESMTKLDVAALRRAADGEAVAA
ncbi:VOC family protein [Conexibacter sp. SYSU D00693]|uniref:VOC family protein n=1 Tax=Conexibacter sp. SYSU D00693 TaxID=2812560 RepID=UPI00196A5404|nr:VOC family protein [Conexibacter sp. SYSU D00693]